MNENTGKLQTKLKNRQTTIGSWITIGSTVVAEIMAQSGFDWLVVDMGKGYDLSGVTYYPRSGGGNGTVKSYAVWVSVDSTQWDSIAGGTWTDNFDQKRVIVFDHVVTGIRYVKFVAKEERNGHGWTTCAELSPFVLGTDFTADKTEIGLDETVQFTDKSGNNPTAWEWTFDGGTPSTSTDQNPVVTYNAAGSYDVQLIAKPDPGDQATWDTLLLKGYITVLAPSISRTDWVKLYVDSEQSGQVAEHVWDGDPSTIWHTDWSSTNPPYPHTLVIDLGAKYSINGFEYIPRSDGGNGTVKDYEFYVLDEEAMWDDPGTWGDPVASGTWEAPWDAVKRVFLDNPVVGRYLIFHPLSERGGNNWASCAELNVMGTLFGSAFSADRIELYATQKVQFTDRSLQKKAWSWSFEGGDPATSTDQNPLVQYNTAGTYDVTLVTVSQNDEKDTLVKSDYITVKARPADKPIEKDGWSIIAFDSQEEPYGRWATNAIDGDITTFWHTAWSEQEPDYPHYLIIDLGQNQDISGFIYYPRSGGGNGTVDSCMFLTSIDAEVWDTVAKCNWTGLGDWGDPRTVKLDAQVTGRFVKFLALSERNNNKWASCGEIEVLTPISGTYFEGEPTVIESGSSVFFLDMTAGSPTEWNWTFESGTPATSTEQSPSVTYNIPYEDLGKSYDVSLTSNGETYTRENYVTVNYFVPKVETGVFIDTLEIGKAYAEYKDQREGGYLDKTDVQITLVRGMKYVVRLGERSPWSGYWRSRAMAVDWNGSLHFDKETEMVYSSQANVPLFDTLDLFYLEVPDDAHLGLTRLRVWATIYGSVDPYGDVPYGEMEDYTVNIVDSSTVAPVAALVADTTEVCAGGEIHFKDISDNTPTEWAWKFEGGTPDTSNFANPVVTYNTPGTYSVTLVAKNSVGADDVTETDYITVYAATPVAGGDDMKVCPGSAVTLTATGTDSLVWNNDVVNGETFYPVDSMAYVVTGYNEHNCAATDTVIVAVWDAVDTSVTKYGEDTLIANADPDMYVFQWVNCDDGTAIDGQTDSIFVAEHGGHYAVVVTQVDGGQCSDTSSCYMISITGINDHFGEEINIYPNPNDGNFTIQIGKEHTMLSVYNAIGTLIYKKKDAASVEEMSLRTNGVYFIKIESDGQVETRRVVVR